MSSVTLLKADPGQDVWRAADSTGETLRKEWDLGGGQVFRSLLGISQAQRQARGARRVERAGLHTPAVLRSPHVCRSGGRLRLRLVLRFVPGEDFADFIVREWETLPEDDRDRLATRLGTIIATLAAHGYRHRDLKLTNIVIGEDRRTLWLIDTVGVKLSLSREKSVWQMLDRIALYQTQTFDFGSRAIFHCVRAACRGLNPSQAARVIARVRASRQAILEQYGF